MVSVTRSTRISSCSHHDMRRGERTQRGPWRKCSRERFRFSESIFLPHHIHLFLRLERKSEPDWRGGPSGHLVLPLREALMDLGQVWSLETHISSL